MALFQFELTPLDEITPWGKPPDLSLSWFGLSLGLYHLDLGETRLLEYLPQVPLPRFVDYQLARLHEDVLSIFPNVLEPIPHAVFRQFQGGSLGATHRALNDIWFEREQGRDPDPDLDFAIETLRGRVLDTSYLSPGAGIWMWSYDDTTVIEWDNRDRLYNGQRVWTADHGRHELPRKDFIDEVRSFNTRLITAMEDRIRQIRTGWNRPHISINLDALELDDQERRSGAELVLSRGARPEDWQTVELALSKHGSGKVS